MADLKMTLVLRDHVTPAITRARRALRVLRAALEDHTMEFPAEHADPQGRWRT